MSNVTLRKAIIPIGAEEDLSTPANGALPAEMVPLVDKPLVQYAVEEALACGFDELILVMRDGLAFAEEHLSAVLRPSAGTGRARPPQILISRHKQGDGLGRAVWSARNLIGEDPFAVLVPTSLLLGESAAMKQLTAAYDRKGGNLVAVADNGIYERAGTFAAISRASAGRYILHPDVFGALERQEDWNLNRAVLSMAEVWPLHAVTFKGAHFDGRTPAGLLEAQIAFGLSHNDLADSVGTILRRYRDGRRRSLVPAGPGAEVAWVGKR